METWFNATSVPSPSQQAIKRESRLSIVFYAVASVRINRNAFYSPLFYFVLEEREREVSGAIDQRGIIITGNSINKEKYRISIFKRWITIRPNEIPFLRA